MFGIHRQMRKREPKGRKSITQKTKNICAGLMLKAES
jgi:hypothetical protein